ncbi:hypothetical protein AA313_de0209446 [Arthrobotrys entomopaga]|nr:hypothetical protein AA313_de0209446 [Arthrobotrys entomopaga]
MPKSLRKIQSQIKQKRGASSTALIEDSRDARRLRKGMLRQERLIKSDSARQKFLQPKVQRFRHFQNILRSGVDVKGISATDILKYIDEFLSSLDEEIKRLSTARREGRPRSAQEDRLRNSLEREIAELDSGYEIPDVFDNEAVKLLLGWKGDTHNISQIKRMRITREGKVLPAG